MPPPASPPPKANKPYFFYGHRTPSQNRPTVRGGLFSNRETLKPQKPPSKPSIPFDIHKWDPHFLPQNPSPPPSPSPSFSFSSSPRLSPIARFIIDAFRKNRHTWGPSVVSELNKLRRVPPTLVAEVLKLQTNPTLASKFFHWAGPVMIPTRCILLEHYIQEDAFLRSRSGTNLIFNRTDEDL